MEKISSDELINWWLEKYHNTNVDKILKENPEWEKNPEEHTREFYKKYEVTEEQHDEWHKWAISTIAKKYKWSKEYARKQFAFPYLNVAPSIKTMKITL